MIKYCILLNFSLKNQKEVNSGNHRREKRCRGRDLNPSLILKKNSVLLLN